MTKVFGEKKNARYLTRKGAYIIPKKDGKIAVVKTPKGYFLIGGGIEFGESDEACIIRECLEEIGYEAVVGEYICSAETYTEHPEIGYFHPVQNYYYGELTEKVLLNQKYNLEWVDYKDIKGNLFAEMQNWALEQCINHKK